MSPRKPDENGSPPAPAQGPDRTKPDAPRRIKKPRGPSAHPTGKATFERPPPPFGSLLGGSASDPGR